MAGQFSGIMMVVGTLGAAFAMNVILWLLVQRISKRRANPNNLRAAKRPGWTMFAPRHTSFLTLPAHSQPSARVSRPRYARRLRRIPVSRVASTVNYPRGESR